MKFASLGKQCAAKTIHNSKAITKLFPYKCNNKIEDWWPLSSSSNLNQCPFNGKFTKLSRCSLICIYYSVWFLFFFLNYLDLYFSCQAWMAQVKYFYDSRMGLFLPKDLDVRGFECFSNWSYGKNFKWICSIRITLFLIWIIQFGYIFCIILICIHMLPNMSISILICSECVKLQRFQKCVRMLMCFVLFAGKKPLCTREKGLLPALMFWFIGEHICNSKINATAFAL